MSCPSDPRDATRVQRLAVRLLAGEVGPAIVWHGVQPSGEMLARTDTTPGLMIRIGRDGGLGSPIDAREVNAAAMADDERRVLAWVRRTIAALERLQADAGAAGRPA